MSFGLMPFDFFQNAMYLAMLEEAESGKAGTQPVKEYSSNRPKKSECFASAFLFSDFFGMFPCLKKSRGSGQSPVFITAINFVIFEKLLSRDFTSLTFVSLIISILTPVAIKAAEVATPYVLRGLQCGGLHMIKMGTRIVDIFRLPLGILQITLGAPFNLFSDGIRNSMLGVLAPLNLLVDTLLLPLAFCGVTTNPG